MEGYFPKGAPKYATGSRESYIKHVVKELEKLAKLEGTIASDDLLGHLMVINEFLKILPYSTSLMIDKAELLEALAETDDDPRFKEAEVLYRKAIEMEPGNTTAKINLGLLLDSGGRHAEAHPILLESHVKLMEQILGVSMALLSCQDHGIGGGVPSAVQYLEPVQQQQI
jgi:predicted Zn-dependent protease